VFVQNNGHCNQNITPNRSYFISRYLILMLIITSVNLIDYYTIIFNFVYVLVIKDTHYNFYSLPSNDPQLSWAAHASHQLNPALARCGRAA